MTTNIMVLDNQIKIMKIILCSSIVDFDTINELKSRILKTEEHLEILRAEYKHKNGY